MSNRDRDNSNFPDASKAQEIVGLAKQMASQMGHNYVTLEHIMLSMLNDVSVQKTFFNSIKEESFINEFIENLMNKLKALPASSMVTSPRPNGEVKEMMEISSNKALSDSSEKITVLDLLDSLLSIEGTSIVSILRQSDIDVVDIREYISENKDSEELDSSDSESKVEAEMTASEKVLRKYCRNFNELVGKKKIDPVFGREKEVEELTVTLSRKTKKNAILTGNPGVGKTAVVEGLAHRIVNGDVPESLKDATVWELDATAVVAGAKFRGDMEERVKNIIKALEKEKNPILFIDEIHTIIGAGESSGGSMDMANILKPALARGAFKCIGATTDMEYRKYFEKDKALDRRFKKVNIDEPSVEMATAILEGIAPVYSEFHGVVYEEDAVKAMVTLSDRYITNKFLPDKAIDIMDISGAVTKIMNQILGEENPVTLEVVQNEVAKIAKIPTVSVKEDEAVKLENLEDDLKKVVFDQDKAVTVLSNSVLLARAGLRPRNKTNGNYLLCGGSGTGKSQLCKQLAKSLDMKLICIDMSEYMEPHSVSKLIGSPPGYVGYGDGEAGDGIIINALSENPHCILLLDEIEKAHPSVFNLFLQVMDDGKITSSSGKKVDCSNIILAMTSNAGAADASKDSLGFIKHETSSKIMKAVERLFTPEFRNRLDAILEFKPLSRETMVKIIKKFVDEMDELASEKGVEIILDDSAIEYLADKGYDPKMGARPASRVIDQEIKTPLSKEINFGKLKNGGKGKVGYDDEIFFEYE